MTNHSLDHILDLIRKLRAGDLHGEVMDDAAIAGYLAGYCRGQIPEALEELAELRESLRWRDRKTDPPPPDAENGSPYYDFCGKWWRPMPSPYPPDDARSKK